jgi:signal transduction histidine kinase
MRNLLLFLLCSSSLFAQQPLDIARQSLKEASTTQDSIKAYQDLAWFIQRSYIDSSFYYNKKAQKLIERIGDSTAANTNLKELAGYIYRSGDYDKAIATYNEALNRYKLLGDSLNVAKIRSNLGAVYQTASQPEKAMKLYIKALEFFETDPVHEPITAQTLGNIGVLYNSLGNQKEAEKAYLQALAILEKGNNKIALGNVQSNLGGIYVTQKKYEQAKELLEETRELALATSNYATLAAVDHNLGTIAIDQKRFADAKVYFEEALSIKTQLGDLNEAATSQVSLAVIATAEDRYDDAVDLLQSAIKVFEKNNNKERLLVAYPALNAAYIYKNEADSAFVFLDKYTLLRDEMAKENAVQISTELDKKYQTEKKDRELAEQKAALLAKELEVRKTNSLLTVSGILLLAAVLLGFLFYRQQQLKNKQLRQENELRFAMARLNTQQKLEEQRLRISRDLHDNIGSQLTFLISSLDNLKYTQNMDRGLANEQLADLSEFTRITINELRDTIWAMNKGRISIDDLRSRLLGHINRAKHVDSEITLKIGDNVNATCSYSAVDGMHIFRIIQEALNNAIKYSEASNIDISIENESEDHIEIVIHDNGKGFETESDCGNGIKNMRERTLALQGSIDIHSEIDEGCKITVVVPEGDCDD